MLSILATSAIDCPLHFTVKKRPKHRLGKTSALKNEFQPYNRLTAGEGLSQDIFTVKIGSGIVQGWHRIASWADVRRQLASSGYSR